jgi:hypothetical protein
MNDDIFLLAIRGRLRSRTQEEARNVHNMTAGNPQGVAAARALGDLSHNVYVTSGGDEANESNETKRAGELLILDLWNNLEGFGKFFSDKQVQEGGNMIFEHVEHRDIFVPAHDFRSFVLPTPASSTARFVGLVRGTVRSRDAARTAFGRIAKENINAARMAGQVSHQTFFLAPQPGKPESLELLGVDVWMDAAGMGRYYADPKHLAPLADVFSSRPAFSMWKRPAGVWSEW